MGNVINLNKYRKQRAKAERDERAGVNRRLHGRSKAERAREALQKQQLTRSVDGARLVRPEPGESAVAPGADPARPADGEESGEPEGS